MFISTAYAQAAVEAGPSMFQGLVPIFGMILICYFLLIRPQARRQKQHEDMIKNLKKGDNVITSGGIFGEVTGLTEKFVTLEVADEVRIKVLRAQVQSLAI